MEEKQPYILALYGGKEKKPLGNIIFERAEGRAVISCELPEEGKKVMGRLIQLDNGEWELTSPLADDLGLSKRWADYDNACQGIADAVMNALWEKMIST